MAERDEFAELLPPDVEALEPEEELRATDDALEGDDITVPVEPTPAPVGRSWASALEEGRTFKMAGHQPMEVRGEETLRGWVHKCLITPEGGSPVHPEGYGMETSLTEMLGRAPDAAGELDTGDLENQIRRALTFNPAIADVEDFEFDFNEDEGDAWLCVRFTVVSRDGATLTLEADAEGVNPAADASLAV